jgi:beta-glucosidase
MGRMEGGRRTTATLPLPVLLLAVVVVGVSLQGRRCIAQAAGGGGLTRGSFPKGFVFGTAAAAYQVRRGSSRSLPPPPIFLLRR